MKSYIQEPITEFLRELASDKPVPGGGSVAALCGALSAAILAMVCRISLAKEQDEGKREQLTRLLAKIEPLSEKLSECVDNDIAAYSKLAQAYRMRRGTEEEREKGIAEVQAALIEAIAVPLESVRLCAELLDLCPTICQLGRSKVITDAAVAALLADAGLSSSALMVRTNLKSLKDSTKASQFQQELSRYLEGKDARVREVLEATERPLIEQERTVLTTENAEVAESS